MHRRRLLQQLETYSPGSDAEARFRASFLSFIAAHPDCFERSLQKGHITGSAWIVNSSRDKALLMHHFKLDKWLQPGGHADGDPDIVRVATREAMEETGLSVRLLDEHIFDIDIHTIPVRKNEAEHLHYDVRFLFEADDEEPLKINSESKALAWLPKPEIQKLTGGNESIMRMAEKVM